MVTLREATAEDALLISRINAASWRIAYKGLIDSAYLSRLPDDYWLPTLRAWLQSGQMYGLIAMEQDHATGAIIYGRGREEQYGDCWEIVSLYLLPNACRRGVGSLLLKEAARIMQEEGYDRCYVWAIEGNEQAASFYRKHGFIPTDDRVPYRIGGRDVTDVRYIRQHK